MKANAFALILSIIKNMSSDKALMKMGVSNTDQTEIKHRIKITDEVKKKIFKLAAEGIIQREIGNQVKLSEYSVNVVLRATECKLHTGRKKISEDKILLLNHIYNEGNTLRYTASQVGLSVVTVEKYIINRRECKNKIATWGYKVD